MNGRGIPAASPRTATKARVVSRLFLRSLPTAGEYNLSNKLAIALDPAIVLRSAFPPGDSASGSP